MPIYNHGHLLNRAVTAIVAQSLRPDELFLIDDGSTDETAEIIKDLADLYSFITPIFLAENIGAEAAIKHVWDQVTGEYIYFAAADDVVCGDFFSTSTSLLENHPEISFCTALTDEITETIPPLSSPSPKIITPQQAAEMICQHGTWFRCNTAIYRTKPLKSLGGIDPDLGPFGDGFICMHLAVKTGCAFVPEVYCKVNVDHASTSRVFNENPMALVAIFRKAENKMIDELRSVFPADVIDAWGRQWRLTLAKRLLQTTAKDWDGCSRVLIPPLNQLDIYVLRLLAQISKRASNAYLLLRLIPSQFFQRVFRH